YLAAGGRIFLEHEADQGAPARRIGEASPAFEEVRILRDGGGHERVLAARRRGSPRLPPIWARGDGPRFALPSVMTGVPGGAMGPTRTGRHRGIMAALRVHRSGGRPGSGPSRDRGPMVSGPSTGTNPDGGQPIPQRA